MTASDDGEFNFTFRCIHIFTIQGDPKDYWRNERLKFLPVFVWQPDHHQK
jgi:hypothetical protein